MRSMEQDRSDFERSRMKFIEIGALVKVTR